ncbi:DUF2309 domain-containing protein [Myxococcus sp. CA039A]|uniref:DUF2309 domain-containing protein n=1 Tax=Myxococcus sp. CA039A TaxID=2741737 RepID=UPI00157A5991|nr:DUF2309 domain-containing protein [Myxococcus sp. CA039A]NTX50570.1 DUF2309 family protein [Myxococcus sp. CA039A]
MSHAPCPTSSPSPEDRGSRLRAALAGASHVLPAQGPIGVFVHHNTLHAYQHLPFHEAVATASKTFGAEGYLSEARFLELYRRGRITDEDLRAVLAEPEHRVPPCPFSADAERQSAALTAQDAAPAEQAARFADSTKWSAFFTNEPCSAQAVAAPTGQAVHFTLEPGLAPAARRDARAPASRLLRDAQSVLGGLPPRAPMELMRLALLHPVEVESEASLRWKLEEHSAAYRLRADLSPTTRHALLERSAQGLRIWMDRVGRGRTMTELACALLGPDVESTVRAVASHVPRPLPVDVALRLLGIPAACASAYVDRVSALLDGETSFTREDWLSAEASCVTSALASAFGGDGSLGSLRERMETNPEPFAVSALWSSCRTPLLTTQGHDKPPLTDVRSHRELLCEATGEDVNDLLHPLLIRACAAFLDEGVSHWNLPSREHGFHAAWRSMTCDGLGAAPDWLEGLEDEPSLAPEDAVLEALDALGVPDADWEPYLVRVLLALPGWAGMFHRLEHHPGDRPSGAPPARLMDFVAVRLTLEQHALREVARQRLDYTGPLSGLAEAARRTIESRRVSARSTLEGSWRLFQWAQLMGLSAMDVAELPLRARHELLTWLEAFDASARQRVWQAAYEHHYRRDVCRGLARNRLRPESERTVTAARFQVMFCMDDREESFRRHFEELDARHETFGIAGFFGVAFDYRGLDDAGHVALCPVVVTPAHVVEEQARPEHQPLAEIRVRRRGTWARLDQTLQQGTHALEVSWLLVPLLGLLSALLLPWQLLFPRTLGRLRRTFSATLLPRPPTRLTSLREPTAHCPSPTLKPLGFTLDEKAARVAASLESLGLVKDFAPLVVVLGHGAVSVNNPHQAAYDCGACGGRHGGPNARLFAEMANRPEVRARLRERGLHIPETTWFIGGLHNTTTDEVCLHDTEALPEALHGELSALRAALDRARALSAQERCRRFESAPLGLSTSAALRHVEARAEDLGQPRPELGHVTIASCIVGRRALTRGLFLDRRAFLISYDPTRDASGEIVERILLAAGPVGAGISLEYYFSCVDNERYGCGTKLPHNLTGLLGVMDGAESDLRTGLPRQMIEIHEPMRLLLVVEASTSVLSAILARQPTLHELIHHQWVQLVSVDPMTGAQHRFTPSGFQWLATPETSLPEVASSPHWYRGHRDFLPPALILAPRSFGEDRHAAP